MFIKIKKVFIGFLLSVFVFQFYPNSVFGVNPFPPEILKHNTKTYYESQRFSLFLVLSRLSLEELNSLLQQCLSLAFEEGKFNINEEMLGKIIDQTFREGMSAFLAEYLAPGSNDYANALYEKMQDKIGDKFKQGIIDKKQECITKCIADQGVSQMEKCAEKCAYKEENAKTSKAISDLLLKFLTGDLKSQLGPGIKNILNQELRYVIFDKKINDILSTSTAAVLNKVFNNVLNKSLADEVPALKKLLGTKVVSKMAPSLIEPLEKIDRLLTIKMDNFQEKMNAKIDILVARMVDRLKEAITQTKDQTSPEYNTIKEACCNMAYARKEHWYWDRNNEKCVKATRDDITNRWSMIKNGLYGDNNIMANYCAELRGLRQSGFCEMAIDSCWDSGQCKQCDKPASWKEAFSIGRWWSSLTKNLFTALLAMPQQIMLALIDTAGHTAAEFTKVWVEDNFIADLAPYFSKVSNFQKKLHKYLNATVADILPKQATALMASNADQILEKMCKDPVYYGLSADEQAKACDIYNELHKDLLTQLGETGELGKEIKDALKSAVFDLLPGNWQDALNKSIAEIFWPEITNIKNLIKGTPKQFICGELLAEDFNVKTATNQASVFDKCVAASPAGLRTTASTIGLLPYIDQESAFWIATNQKENYAISCPIVWYLCQNPLSQWVAKIGDTIVKIIDNQCKTIETKTGTNCKWNDFALSSNLGCDACKAVNRSLAFTIFKYGIEEKYNASTTARTPIQKSQERSAYQWLFVAFPLLRDSSGIQDFYGGVKQVALARGFIETEWSALIDEVKNWTDLDVLPDNTNASSITFVSWLKDNKTFRSIFTSIPLGVIKPFNPGEATLLRDAGKGSAGAEFLEYKPYDFLRNELCGKVIADFTKDYPTSTINAIMAGEYAKSAAAAAIPYSVESLRKPSVAQAQQILLSNQDIDAERKAQYLTCFALDQTPAELFGIGQKLIEYVRPEAYKVLFTLIKEKLKPEERPTLLNQLLEYLYTRTPAGLGCEILNEVSFTPDPVEMREFVCNFNRTMGERVKRHLPNKEMICLIADKMEDIINDSIAQADIIINSNAAIIYGDTASEAEKDEARDRVVKAQTFKLSTPKIRAIAANCFGKQLLIEDWQALQLFLRKSPLQIIKEYLTQQLLNNKYVNAPPVMDYIAEHSVLGERYVDVLGRWLHLDEPIQDFFLVKEDFIAAVDSVALETVKTIQNSFNKLLIAYPKTAFNWLLKSLGINMGKGMGQDISDQVAGSCQQMEQSKCAVPPNVYNLTTGECCNMGSGLVCEPRCHEKKTAISQGILIYDESCKITEKGQVNYCTDVIAGITKNITTGCPEPATTTVSVAKQYCCSNLSKPCNICREAINTECGRENETLIEQTDTADNAIDSKTYSLCCRERDLKDNGTTDIIDDKCCINVMQCVSDKFISFLEIMDSALLQGPLLEKLKD